MQGTPFRPQVTVPDVVGLHFDEARDVASGAGLVLAQRDADGPPLSALAWKRRCLIVGQHPEPGAAALKWDSLVVDVIIDDGPAGVRKPRRPFPGEGEARAAEPEPHRPDPHRPDER
ncbi:PASTA domain-containing protein [Sinomonas sp. JGH33]|uniref:PASTA domain-containing protein n=1 Tax=Sinomonas terricola TaxID=3110330 RepID=A0ABU5T1W8_9MICC|nr:PASTA domain-containing protein [Sinomonas sp. JGH33]MEA5453649.1 PASTA domain-containing protein [Sinomonas sp. JGH33]